jgi:MYXO-CTERM domain-containing protein
MVFVRQADGNWKFEGYWSPVDSGSQGTPLPDVTLYALLAVLAVVLLLAGWRLRRRTVRLQEG